ncbi:MAG: hypothetical protein C0467_08875 [Planctomycetaceae bacterium]|nr:hypothetical protein [Planctomycetaceae bacterium]
MDVALKVIALTAILYVVYELLRRTGKWTIWTLFVVVPIALTHYWVQTNDFGPFVWIKIYSVCFCVFWGAGVRFTSLGDRPWGRLGIPLLLAGNIIEATALDLIEHGLAHGLNAIAGIGLIVVLPYSANATRIDSESRIRDLLYGTTPSWIIAYTVWNWTFVYLNYPSYAGQHTAVLASGLLVAVIDPRRWAQSRACILGIMLITMATFDAALLSWMDTANWSNERVGVVAACGALACVAKCAVPALRNLWAAVATITLATPQPQSDRIALPCV